MKIRQYIPSFVSGYEPQEAEVSTLEEFLALDWVACCAEYEQFAGFAVGQYTDREDMLMALYRHTPVAEDTARERWLAYREDSGDYRTRRVDRLPEVPEGAMEYYVKAFLPKGHGFSLPRFTP